MGASGREEGKLTGEYDLEDVKEDGNRAVGDRHPGRPGRWS